MLGFYVAYKVWTDSFSQKLAIREQTQHAKCATCTRHKAIIKRLAQDCLARQAQAREFAAHLQLQYRDRCTYWEARAQSRLKEPLPNGLLKVTMITDGMDKSKYRYPRSKILQSKEFDGLTRPALDMVATIVHGYSIVLCLSEPIVPKDSSSTAEVILYSLDRLAGAGIDLRKVSLHLQADNTSREVKNNSIMRLAGVLTASHRLHDVTVSNLMTGHSHEDVDGFFAGVTAHLESNTELHTPEQFRVCLEKYLSNPEIRPRETDRAVVLMDTARDWQLDVCPSQLDNVFWFGM